MRALQFDMRAFFSSSTFLVLSGAIAVLTAAAAFGCGEPPDPRRTNFKIEGEGVTARYDPHSGRLKRLDADLDKDGRIDTYSYWDGTRLLRVEIDKNEDGKIDRWEHYGPDNKMVSVGTSSKDDGVEDTWFYQGADGRLAKIEYDTDRDGKVDKREIYGPSPHDPSARVLVEVDLGIDASGQPARRLFYKPDGSFDHVEVVPK